MESKMAHIDISSSWRAKHSGSFNIYLYIFFGDYGVKTLHIMYKTRIVTVHVNMLNTLVNVKCLHSLVTNKMYTKMSSVHGLSVLLTVSAIYLSRLSLNKALRGCRYSFRDKIRIFVHFPLLSRAVFLSSLQRGLYLPEYLYILSQA